MLDTQNFKDWNLNKSLWNGLEDLDFIEAKPIQRAVFNPIMAGKDIICVANTGTGKTLGYLLPLLRMWTYQKDKLPQILVLVPTIELVHQVTELAKQLSQYMSFDVLSIHGGVNPKVFIKELEKGADLIVSTPGRFIDLMLVGALKTKNIKKVVLDENDLMLDLGFMPQINQILEKLPPKKQILLFSATEAEDTEAWRDEYLKEAIWCEDSPTTVPAQLNQTVHFLPNFLSKINYLELLLLEPEASKALVFVSKKELVDLVAEKLTERGIEGFETLHGNKSYNRRKEIIENFRSENLKILIASDIASRGLDINNISHVFSLDVPEPSSDYVHRVGRTARNGASGEAISLVSEFEKEKWKNLTTELTIKVKIKEVPDFVEKNDTLLDFEIPKNHVKLSVKPSINIVGPAFHEKLEKNKKVNVRRNIEKEKKAKYGKAYKKEQKPS